MKKYFEKYRLQVSQGLIRLRQSRRLSQKELADALDVSQQQLSKIERSRASLTAEQIIYLLHQYNLPLQDFVPSKNDGIEPVLQNALIRLGALHLREVPNISISEKYTKPESVILDTLIYVPSSRLITALAPVIVRHAQALKISSLLVECDAIGKGNTYRWLIDSTANAASSRLKEHLSNRISQLYRNAITRLLFEKFIRQNFEPLDHEEIIDPSITSEKTLKQVREKRDEVAKKWRVITSIQQKDFVHALSMSESING